MVKLSTLRSPGVEKEFPWYAILLGYPVLGIWYWCADQTIVQRVLGAKDENHARTGPLFCAVIKILPLFIFVLPGLLFYTMIRSGRLEQRGASPGEGGAGRDGRAGEAGESPHAGAGGTRRQPG